MISYLTEKNPFLLRDHEATINHPVSGKIKRQLRECERIVKIDGALPVSRLEEEIYSLARYRSMERFVDTIDCFTTYPVRRELRAVMAKHFDLRYATSMTRMDFNNLNCAIGDYDRYAFPCAMVAVFGVGHKDPPALWFLDMADVTEQWDILTPQRHLLIEEFDEFAA